MPTRIKSPQKLRMEIAAMAAKLVAIDGVADYHSAKRKAAVQLGLRSNRNLPTNQEIEEALVKYQSLFQADEQQNILKTLRQHAMQAMKLLQQFRPVLVGPVANGTATRSSEITLHLFSDQMEQVGLFLAGEGIPAQACEKHVKVNATETSVYPAFRFIADQTALLLVVFPEKDRNINPVSSLNNKPMLMLSLKDLTKIAEETNNGITV